MENLWKNLVDQVVFVDYCLWEDVYNDKINEIKKPCSELWRKVYGGMVKRTHVKSILNLFYLPEIF